MASRSVGSEALPLHRHCAVASRLIQLAGMPSPAVIRSFDVAPLDIPLHVPFGISSGAQPMASNVLATIELADGTRGYGEAAPLPPYNGETQADALGALRTTREWI